MKWSTWVGTRVPALVAVLAACAVGCGSGPGEGDDEAVGTAAEAMTATGNLPGGTSIEVTIDDPADGAVVPVGPLAVDGTAEIGLGLPVANTLLVHTVDVSGSTQDGGGCGGDQNGDGSPSTILDCEIEAAETLNGFAIAAGTVAEVGVAIFGSSGGTADVVPAPGTQILTRPGADENGNGTLDVDEVLSSASALTGALSQFSSVTAGPGATNYSAGIRSALSIAAASSQPNKIVVFISDGLNNAGATVASVLTPAPAGVVFHTFAVGASASCTGGSASLGNLQDIADLTGGTCTNVPNVAALPNIIPAVIASQLTALTLAVDGSPGPALAVVPPLPRPGPASVAFSAVVPGLAPGVHTLCVTAEGSDGGGAGSVRDCHTVRVNAPPVARCKDLTLAADATCGGSGSIDAGSFDPDGDPLVCVQSPPGPYPLGTTAVNLVCTDGHGASSACTATVTIADETPPVVTTTGARVSYWPPNHKYQTFRLSDCVTSVTDACDGALSIGAVGQITRITSDEAEDGAADGDTCNDAVIVGATTAQLRAERRGDSDGRVYTVHFTVRDAAGNLTASSCQAQVVHDRSRASATAVDSGCGYCVGTGCGACPQHDPSCTD